MSATYSGSTAIRVGLISDTHGLLRPEAVAALQGCDLIVHGGDIGDVGILEALRAIAPLTAVRGNNDREAWAAGIAETDFLRVGSVLVYAIHDLSQIDIDPAGAEVRVVVSGHSHKPQIEERDGVLYVNPGSAGPRRFKLPIAVAELEVVGETVTARIIELA
ncbi:metallophosphatase family protein [Variovorax sp. S2]|uniref:metallophosphoesterase family protein n=1 Tax=Variovorax sp. S12S4 TaxID=3029170 RepID=UPI00215C5C49|nr:metallophosphoesterase family protein [Variovorax sp. S12S4]MCR8959315.1 metallophosphatase family protein [Variovorax sp. S12S4]